MTYLITGGCGFLGSNLANEVLSRGEEIIIFDNLSRHGSELNLAWLRSKGNFEFVHGDIRNPDDILRVFQRHRPDVVFHLAGQVAMTTSLAEPRLDFETNALGTLNLLECVRKEAPHAKVLYSSTNKVYGDLEWAAIEETLSRYWCPDFPRGFPESAPLAFHSPYGCSKGCADQYMLDYHRMFGISTIVFRHSSMYGGRQFATYDQGWMGWFCQKAIEQKRHPGATKFTISGSGKQVRDVLHADDVVNLYIKAAEAPGDLGGQVFNIGGGVDNSLSLLELFQILEEQLSVELSYERIPVRQSDQRVFIADISKANQLIGWEPKVDKIAGLKDMLKWVSENE